MVMEGRVGERVQGERVQGVESARERVQGGEGLKGRAGGGERRLCDDTLDHATHHCSRALELESLHVVELHELRRRGHDCCVATHTHTHTRRTRPMIDNNCENEWCDDSASHVPVTPVSVVSGSFNSKETSALIFASPSGVTRSLMEMTATSISSSPMSAMTICDRDTEQGTICDRTRRGDAHRGRTTT